MKIKIVPGYDYPQEIKALFSEYTDMLIASDSSVREYLDIQNYEDELNNLKAKYGAPAGRLYLALCDGSPVGCIALRKLDTLRCEVKRLYVRPQYRNLGIAGQLLEIIISDARETGYEFMLLDTLPFLENAVKMYIKYGFYETESYNNSPMSSSIFMALDLYSRRTSETAKRKQEKMSHSKAEDAGGLLSVKDDNEAVPHFIR